MASGWGWGVEVWFGRCGASLCQGQKVSPLASTLYHWVSLIAKRQHWQWWGGGGGGEEGLRCSWDITLTGPQGITVGHYSLSLGDSDWQAVIRDQHWQWWGCGGGGGGGGGGGEGEGGGYVGHHFDRATRYHCWPLLPINGWLWLASSYQRSTLAVMRLWGGGGGG